MRIRKFKRFVCIALSILLAMSNLVYADNEALETVKCPDIAGNKYEAQLREWVDNGFITGDSDGNFKPDKTITRAEFMALVNRSFGFTDAAEINYTDVRKNNWFYKDAAIATKMGYMQGSSGRLNPQDPISRQEVAIVLARLTNNRVATDIKNIDSLSDGKSIPDWSRAAISIALSNGYFEGLIDNAFKPAQKATKLETVVSLDRAFKSMYKAVYMKKGIYGPADGMQTLEGSAVIVSPDVTLRNTTVNGDLILRESIGNGNVYMDNVVVKGTTIVKGGGEHSIVIRNSSLGRVVVRREGNIVRIVATGSTTVGEVDVQSGAVLEEEFLTGEGFGDVVIPDDILAGATIVFEGNFDDVQVDSGNANINVASGTIGSLTLTQEAAGTSVNLSQQASVGTLNANASVNITGQGTIQTANVNAQGVNIEQRPQNVVVASGVTATVGNQTVTPPPSSGDSSGGGGGGGDDDRPTVVSVNSVTVSGANNINTVVNGGTLQMSAVVSPANATNKAISWSIIPGTGAASISATGLLTATGVGTVTVKALNGWSGISGTKVITIVPMITNVNAANASTVTFNSNAAGATIKWNGKVLPTLTMIGVNTITVPLMVSGESNTLLVEKSGFTSYINNAVVWNDPLTYEVSPLGPWENDRTAPDSWKITDGWITYSTKDAPANNWYAWHGKKTSTNNVISANWKVETEFKLTDELLARDGVRTSMWLNVLDEFGENVDWSIVQFNINKDTGAKGWQYWNSDDKGAWVDISADLPTAAGVYKLAVYYADGKVIGYINGVEVFNYAKSSSKLTSVKEVILNSYSFGESYQVEWKVPTVSYVKAVPEGTVYVNKVSELDAALGGSAGTIRMAPGTYELDKQIRINRAINIIGAGDTTIITKGSKAWTNASGSKGHASLITIAGVDGEVKLENLKVTGAANITMTGPVSGTDYGTGINVYSSKNVTLNNVASSNNAAAGLIVNGSTVVANNLNTKGNSWGAVNVDPGSGVKTASVFTLNSGTLEENLQIWSDGKNVDDTVTVAVTAQGYKEYALGGTARGSAWKKEPLTNAATITRSVGDVGTTILYTSINAAIAGAEAGETINVAPGRYKEDVKVNKTVTIIGAGAANTKIIAANANTTPLAFSANGAAVKGFTVTHEYTSEELAKWGNTDNNGINNNGVTFDHGKTGNILEDCIVTLNRNGVYLNNCQNNIIKNNIITNNRTGINTTNNVNGTAITGNTISDNWTIGLVHYTLGAATDFSTVTVSGNTFKDNWYTEVLVKDSISTGELNVTNNTFTDDPVTFTTSADSSLNEPQFKDQMPNVAGIGGAAAKPGKDLPTLRIYNSGSVQLRYDGVRTLNVGASEPYITLAAAVNDAKMGDIIKVAAGTYTENLKIDKANLHLKSIEGAAAAIIQGATIDIMADNVTIEGFTIDNNDGERAIAPMGSTGTTIKNNTIVNSKRGIQGDYYGRPTNLTITGNIFNTQYGIAGTEDMKGLLIKGNTFNTTTEAIGLGKGVELVDEAGNTVFTDYAAWLKNNNTINDGQVVVDYRTKTVETEAELIAALGNKYIETIVVNGAIQGNFTIDRAVTLKGTGTLSNNTSVGAPILSITGEGVVIDGLTLNAEVGASFNNQTIGINILSSNVTVRNCTVNVTGNKSAIGLQSGMTANDVVIDHNTIKGNDALGCAAIALNADGTGIEITNNTVTKGAIGSGPLSKATAQDITITGNIITNSMTEGLFLIVNEASLKEAAAIAVQLNTGNTITDPGTTNVLVIYNRGNLYFPLLTSSVSNAAELEAALADTKVGTINFGEDINLDETLVVNRAVAIDGAGYSVDKAINITGDNVTVMNLKGTVVDRTVHKLPEVGSPTAIFVNAKGVILNNITVDGEGVGTTPIGVIGWKGAQFTVQNSTFTNLTTGIFAHLGNTQSDFQNRLTAEQNTFENVWAGIGGTEKTDLTATGNTFISVKEGGEGIGLGIGSVVVGVIGDSDVAYLESENDFRYTVGKEVTVRDYRTIVVPEAGDIQAIIDAAGAGTKIRLDGDTYNLAAPLKITKAVSIIGQGAAVSGNIEIDSDNAIVEGLVLEGQIIVIRDHSNITIKDNEITYDNLPLSIRHGSSNIEVIGNTITGTYDDQRLVYVDSGSSDVSFRNNTFTGKGRLALGMDAENCDVEGNIFEIESGNASAKVLEVFGDSTTITGNTFDGDGLLKGASFVIAADLDINAIADNNTFGPDLTIDGQCIKVLKSGEGFGASMMLPAAPVITLVGEATISLTVGDDYVEAGATAVDEQDGDLTAAIVIEGTVDTSIEGVYTITYKVSDAAGNTAEATRTVIVEAVEELPGTGTFSGLEGGTVTEEVYED